MHAFDLTVQKESSDDGISGNNPHHADYWLPCMALQSETFSKVDH